MNYKERHKQFFLFVLAGSIAGIVNFSFRIIVNQWVSFSTAICLAYLVGMMTAFILSKAFVFRKTEHPLHRMFFTYTIINLFGLAQTLAISLIFAHYILPALGVYNYVDDLAHAIGLIAPIYVSYLGHKNYTFR
ncbi:GtrA family protein [Legionella sp. km772]|uniref:GtrA family protein n=1 Tax=Legionella sp. km772 TaxID=2498111 RepID=UPI000F8D85ED|nr:GtrA family protein [Legionella sp. km772]RUR11158.1 GtrA family protein [Legionella sp. km772]